MLSHPAVIGANAALAVLWIVAIVVADGDVGRAVGSFLAAVHGSLAFVGVRRRGDDR